MSATQSHPLTFRVGDIVVNKHTGQKVAVSKSMKDSGVLQGGHYVHEKDRPPMPRSERARLNRAFQ